MPNHCSNVLLVGAHDNHRGELEAFHKIVSTPIEKTSVDHITGEETTTLVSGYFLCDNVFPCPQELHQVKADFTPKPDMVAKYGASDWYDWCTNNWGSKWGDYDTDYLEEMETPNLRAYRYTTAWSPIIEAIRVFAKKFPNLVFINTFEEGGMAFLGAVAVINEDLYEAEEGYPEVDWDSDDPGFEKVEQAQVECVRTVLRCALEDSGITFDATTFDPYFGVMA